MTAHLDLNMASSTVAKALLGAAGLLKPNAKTKLKKSTATEHATSSSRPDPVASTSTATEHATSSSQPDPAASTSHIISHQMSGADLIVRLLQSILRRCYVTVILPLGRVLQSIAQMVLHYAKIAMKLIIMFSALLRGMLTLCTPLELAACFHLVEAYIHRNVYTYHCDSHHCRVSAVSAPSAQNIATMALALVILGLSIIDWHVPRCFRSHQLLCRILTAMSMHALGVELACEVIAFLLPTFGKISQDRARTSRKRPTPTRHATEQTPEISADAEATMQDPGNASILRCSDADVEPDAATEHIASASYGSAREASSGCRDMTIESIDDVVSKLSSARGKSAAALRKAVKTLQSGVQAEIRNLCKPWGVQLTTKNDNGKYSKRAGAVLKTSLRSRL